MKINKIKIGLIALVLFLAPTRSNSSSCLNLLKGSSAGITAVTVAECSFLMIFTGGVITSAALTAISAYKNRIMPDNSLDVQSLYQQGVAEYKAAAVISPTQQGLDMAGSVKVIKTIASTLDTNFGYSPGTADNFFAQASADNPDFSFVDIVNFASNAVQTLGTTTVNGTKITLPEAGQYKNFDDYIIRNGITNTGKLTDLITQASARGSDGLLPQVYEPSDSSGPSAPSTPVGPKIPDTQYQQLQEIYQQSQLRLNQQILEIQDVTARMTAIDSLKAQIQADLLSADEGSAEQAKAQGELEAFKKSFPDVDPPVDV